MSSTTSTRPSVDPGAADVTPTPKWIEQADPGGGVWTIAAAERRGSRRRRRPSASSLLLSVWVRSVSEDRRRTLGVRFVDEETHAARDVQRVDASGVVGSKPRRDSRGYERRLGELRV